MKSVSSFSSIDTNFGYKKKLMDKKLQINKQEKY